MFLHHVFEDGPVAGNMFGICTITECFGAYLPLATFLSLSADSYDKFTWTEEEFLVGTKFIIILEKSLQLSLFTPISFTASAVILL